VKTLREVFKEALDSIGRRHKKRDKLAGVPSGFRDIDFITDGFQPELYVIGGRPSMGKSALLKDLVINAAKARFHCHLINIEDGNLNTAKRMLSGETDIELWKLRKCDLTRDNFNALTECVASFAEKETDLIVTLDDTVAKADAIEESIMNAYKKYGLNIVFIDYLQLIQANASTGQRRLEEIGNITRRLKELSKPSNLGIPFVVTAQLNRSVEARENRRPLLSDLRESGEIEQHADVVCFLYRDAYYTHDKDDKKAEFIIAKGRNIGTGIIPLYFDDMKTTFKDWNDGTGMA